jgi:putative ABC transport system permease protein
MVTHNKDIAEEFSDRVVNLLDGLVIDDSNPSENVSADKMTGKLINKKTSMSYLTALQTSFKNLLTKKGRTLITALAGSIGIIGIALVLAVSSGMTSYVDELQSDTLAGFPLTIEQYYVDFAQVGQERLSEEGYFPEGEEVVGYDPQSEFITHANIITDDFLTYLDGLDETTYNSISYTSSMDLNIAAAGTVGGNELLEDSYYDQLPNNETFVLSQYDVIKGDFPQSMNDVVIVVDAKNRLDNAFIEDLGLSLDTTYTFDDLIGLELKVFPNDLYYSESGGLYSGSNDISSIYNDSDAITLTVSGVIRVNEDASTDLVDSGIAYTEALTNYMLSDAMDSDVVAAQLASPTASVVSGLNIYEVLLAIGGTDVPSSIQIYPVSFDSKEEIKDYISAYNLTVDETYAIYTTDLAAIISSSISSLIGTITIILSAFAGISLVVSSIMIGIITYVSVVERTKEIGIMRSLGARKKDISRIFNAETVLIGLTSGILGVVITLLLIIPINIILSNLVEVSGFANLMWSSAISLIVLSTVLTLVAGLIPSRIAAKKDPVTALRTE